MANEALLVGILDFSHKSAMSMPNLPSLLRNGYLALHLSVDDLSLREAIFQINRQYSERENQPISDQLRAQTISNLYALFNASIGAIDTEDFLFLAPVEARSLIAGGIVDDRIKQEVEVRIDDRISNGAQNHTPENTLTIGRVDAETLLIREVGTRSFPITINGKERFGEINEYKTYALKDDGITRLGIELAEPHYHNYATLPNGKVEEQRIPLPYSKSDIAQIFQDAPHLPTEVSDQELSVLLHHVVYNIVDPRLQLKSSQIY